MRSGEERKETVPQDLSSGQQVLPVQQLFDVSLAL